MSDPYQWSSPRPDPPPVAAAAAQQASPQAYGYSPVQQQQQRTQPVVEEEDPTVQVPLKELEEHLEKHPVDANEEEEEGEGEEEDDDEEEEAPEAQVVEDADNALATAAAAATAGPSTAATEQEAQDAVAAAAAAASSNNPSKRRRSRTPKAMTQKQEEEWRKRYEELKAYKAKHGHVKVPYSRKVGLGQWVRSQRQRWQRGSLRPDMVQALDELGFVWNPNGQQKTPRKPSVPPKSFEERFEMLKAFQQKFGDLNLTLTRVEKGDEDTKAMISYFKNLRRHYNNNELAADKVEKLNAIGFDWSPQPLPPASRKKKAATGINPAAKRAKTDGTTPNQGQQATTGTSPQHQQQNKSPLQHQLWEAPEPDQEEWDENLQKLRIFKREKGHSNVPVPDEYKEDPGLARWIRHVRFLARTGDLTLLRIAQLDNLKFDYMLPHGQGRPLPRKQQPKSVSALERQMKALQGDVEKVQVGNKDIARQVEETKILARNQQQQRQEEQQLIKKEFKNKERQMKRQTSTLKTQGQQLEQLLKQMQDMNQKQTSIQVHQDALQQQQDQIMQQQQELIQRANPPLPPQPPPPERHQPQHPPAHHRQPPGHRHPHHTHHHQQQPQQALPQQDITNQLQDAIHQRILQRNTNPYDNFWR